LGGEGRRGGRDKVWERSHGDKQKQTNKGCVSHCGLAIYIKKYLKAKEELWKLNYFTMPKYDLQQILPKKKPQNPSRYYNSIITNLKFSTQAKI
jgi:hypothetical protein